MTNRLTSTMAIPGSTLVASLLALLLSSFVVSPSSASTPSPTPTPLASPSPTASVSDAPTETPEPALTIETPNAEPPASSPIATPITNTVAPLTLSVPGLATATITGYLGGLPSTLPPNPLPSQVPMVQIWVNRGTVYTLFTSVPIQPDGSYSFQVPTDYPGIFTYQTRFDSLSKTGVLTTTASAPIRVTVTKALSLTTRRVTKDDVRYSWRKGCPVGPRDLRLSRFAYLNNAGQLTWGEMITHYSMIRTVRDVFRTALVDGYRFTRVGTVEAYRGDDAKAIAADNTSAFNCREVTGVKGRVSPHSYGTAFDINTVKNPYQDRNGRWWPDFAHHYRDRNTQRPGMLFLESPVTQAFLRNKQQWGGLWRNADYQHFDLADTHFGRRSSAGNTFESRAIRAGGHC